MAFSPAKLAVVRAGRWLQGCEFRQWLTMPHNNQTVAANWYEIHAWAIARRTIYIESENMARLLARIT